MSWNIGGAPELHLDAAEFSKNNKALDIIRRLEPDIICLQEAHFLPGSKESELAKSLIKIDQYNATSTLLSWTRDVSHVRSDLEIDSEIITTFHVTNVERHKLTNPQLRHHAWRSHDKYIDVAHVDVRGQSLAVYNLHLLPFHKFGCDPDDPIFDGIWDEIAEVLQQRANDPLRILAGDLNIDQSNHRFSVFQNAGFSPLFMSTWTDSHSKRQLDWVMCSNQLEAVQVVTSEDLLSDHRLLLADYEFVRTK